MDEGDKLFLTTKLAKAVEALNELLLLAEARPEYNLHPQDLSAIKSEILEYSEMALVRITELDEESEIGKNNVDTYTEQEENKL